MATKNQSKSETLRALKFLRKQVDANHRGYYGDYHCEERKAYRQSVEKHKQEEAKRVNEFIQKLPDKKLSSVIKSRIQSHGVDWYINALEIAQDCGYVGDDEPKDPIDFALEQKKSLLNKLDSEIFEVTVSGASGNLEALLTEVKAFIRK